MKLEQLSDLVSFTIGKNPTRIKEQELILYSLEDFENDLYGITEQSNKSECIINLIKSKVAPVSVDNKDKCITSNFLKCEFNEGKDFEQQIAMVHQGTTLSVKKLNMKIVGELKIRLPDIETQHKIGEIYRQSLVQNRLMIKRAEDIKKLTLTIIRKLEED